jgi:Peptidase_C39 like family
MPFLQVLVSTLLKSQPIDSSKLSAKQKQYLSKDQRLEISEAIAQNNHLKIKLIKPANGWTEGYVFMKDVQIERPIAVPQPGTIRLSVEFSSQMSREGEPSDLPKRTQERMCNSSANFMVARFLGAKVKSDDAFYRLVTPHGDTTDHSAISRALDGIGIKSSWHTNLGFADLDRSLEAGVPVVLGILHRDDSWGNPTGGHMIVAIGRTPGGDYIFHDPFGSLLDTSGGYTGDVNNGNSVVYPRSLLQRRWLPEGANSGWGRLFVW